MRASFKHHHLNNIKVDLQDKKMTLLVIHYKLISRYTELRTRKKRERRELLLPCFGLQFLKKKKKMTVHDNIFSPQSLGLIPKSGLSGNKGHHF